MKLKSLLSIIGLMLLVAGSVVSCGPSKAEREEAARLESIRIADSIAKAEEKARLAIIEQARQDSLARIEKFKESIPPFREIYFHFAFFDNKYKQKINLEELGFTKKTKVIDHIPEFDMDITEDQYRLELDSEHYCLITEQSGMEAKHLTFKIVGFPELMDKYIDEARSLKSSAEFTNRGSEPSMQILKNEIKWEDGL